MEYKTTTAHTKEYLLTLNPLPLAPKFLLPQEFQKPALFHPDSSSNSHWPTTVPVNARVKLTTAYIKDYIVNIAAMELLSYNVITWAFELGPGATLEVQGMGSNPRKILTTGPERDCKEISVRLVTKSTNVLVDSDHSSNDEYVGRSKFL
ncbi:hypothetical protein EC957_001209 [Mortierella hygrophila]|uniref:Uncharacterized protein n=1 Tax=Mortierella hygrophila TaxID=979708 RepID=A0A9P6F5U5_9FUNG|nr:hypothetical protein EC957_001209 [Mortierella hygrophila]